MKHIWVCAALILCSAAVILYLKKGQKARKEELQAKQEILDHVKHFSGCYQPLFDATESGNLLLTQKLLESWKARMNGHAALESYFDKLSIKEKDPLEGAKKWIRVLERWGIRHDLPGTIINITKDHEKLYLFDDVYALGASARVVRPAWWLETEEERICIETGGAEIE